ncbi:uncharacterized protein [Haliotis cracherodii]|uniref:uncharacterized protein n=1 Tax=Haliotis cracherodii TaxID=6455 RepID=UPI0039E8DA16
MAVAYQQLHDMSQTHVCSFRPPGGERGRQGETILNDLYHRRHRLVVLYGEIFAGKTHFAKQVIECLKGTQLNTCGDALNHVTVRCLGVTTWSDFLKRLADVLELNTTLLGPSEFKVKLKIGDLIRNFAGVGLILLFTNFEDVYANEAIIRMFSLFVNDVLDAHAGVSVIVTSRVSVSLSNRHEAISHKLLPMSERECVALLDPVRSRCRTLAPLYNIVRRCCHRPGLILRICTILQLYPSVLTPDDVARALEDPRKALDVFSKYPTPGGCIVNALEEQFGRLAPELKADTITLCGLQGHFGVKKATRRLGKGDVTNFKLQTALPLREHTILDFDPNLRQMRIDPFIRAFVSTKTADVPHHDSHRKLIVDFLGQMLLLMRCDASVKTKGRALGFAHDNFRSFEMTLTQAVNTHGEDTFKVYLKVIDLEECTMSAVCPEKAVNFYSQMAEAAYKFGTPREQAVLQGFTAVSLIEQRGDQLPSAVSLVTNALQKLTVGEDDYHRVVLMRRLGWMHVRLGNNKVAKRHLTEALETPVPAELNERVEPHRIQIQSHLAIVNSYLGNFPETERILRRTIPRAHQIMPGHPVLAVMIQTMGINFDRQCQLDKALVYYKLSCHERRKLASTLPTYLVTNLNNLAANYTWRGECDKALRLLTEALNLRRKLGWYDFNTALTLWYRGTAYCLKGLVDDAVRSCHQALEVIIRCTPRHPSNVDVRISLAHAYMAKGDRKKAEATLVETLDYVSLFQSNVNEISLLSALEHLVLMREGEKDFGTIHKLLTEEAQRLINVFGDTDSKKNYSIHRKLSLWRVYCGEVLCRREDRKNPSSHIDWKNLFTCRHCSLLGYNHEHWKSGRAL